MESILARPAVESMLARSLAWQFLKQCGLKRPKVVIIKATYATAKLDIQKYKRSSTGSKNLRDYTPLLSYRKP